MRWGRMRELQDLWSPRAGLSRSASSKGTGENESRATAAGARVVKERMKVKWG